MMTMPIVGDSLKIKIHERSGGFYIGKVIHVTLLPDDRSFAMVKLARKYQNGKITSVDLEKKTIQIPLYVNDLWEFNNGK